MRACTGSAALSHPIPSTVELDQLDPATVRDRLAGLDDEAIALQLSRLRVGHAIEVLEEFNAARRIAIASAAPQAESALWLAGHTYPEGSVARLAEPAVAVFKPHETVGAVLEALRPVVRERLVTYVFVVDAAQHLVGVVAFRELAFATADATLDEIMVPEPFFLRPEMPLVDAMREVVTRHYPVYPVATADGRLLGLVRGQTLFEQQAFAISAQAGAMFGVEREERIATPWSRSFRFRHPWLLLNLLTVFAAAAVVGAFQDTIDRLVVLAMFLPVLAGQCGNLGAQSLAVTLRGMTLGEIASFKLSHLVSKEGGLGLLNGALTGFVAAVAMYVIAGRLAAGDPLTLALATWAAMTVSCGISGVAGALIPVFLRRVGADPATASSILLTTATDVFSMGSFLALASWWVR